MAQPQHLTVDDALAVALEEEDSPDDVRKRLLSLVTEAQMARWMRLHRDRLLHEYIRELIRKSRRQPNGHVPPGASAPFTPTTRLAGSSSPYDRRAPFLHIRIRTLSLADVREIIARYGRVVADNQSHRKAWQRLEALLAEHGVDRVGELDALGIELPEGL